MTHSFHSSRQINMSLVRYNHWLISGKHTKSDWTWPIYKWLIYRDVPVRKLFVYQRRHSSNISALRTYGENSQQSTLAISSPIFITKLGQAGNPSSWVERSSAFLPHMTLRWLSTEFTATSNLKNSPREIHGQGQGGKVYGVVGPPRPTDSPHFIVLWWSLMVMFRCVDEIDASHPRFI